MDLREILGKYNLPLNVANSLQKELEILLYSCKREIEAEIQISLEMLRNTFNAMPDPAAIWERTIDGKIVLKDINTSFKDVTQGRMSENIGKTPQEIYGSDSQVVKRLEYVMKSGLPMTDGNFHKGRFTTPGRYFLVESIKILEDHVLSIARDYTEDIRIEEELLRSNERFRALFEYSPVGLFEEDYSKIKKFLKKLHVEGVEDINGYLQVNSHIIPKLINSIRILDMNKAAIELYKGKKKTDILERLYRYPSPRAHSAFLKELNFLWNGLLNFTYESSLQTVDGDIIHTVIGFTIVPGYEKSWEKVLISISDISKRIEAEKVRKELEKRRDNFVWMTSHELRTPLTVVIGYCDFLTKHIDNIQSEQRAKILDIVKRNLQRLERFINDVTILTKIDQGILKIQTEDVDICQLLWDTLSLYQHLIEDRISTNICQSDEKVVLQVDRERIQQVILNVLENAIKNSPKEKTLIDVSLSILSDKIIIKISDSGAGIAKENLERIFEQFVSIPTEFSSGGTGIGLHLCREILDAHNGSISADSPGIGKGSSFTIILPRGE
ncbi:MAG: PAS domain-containing sensor histidine kinase [Candidatus Heimdallarchaeota archaeon]|nr:PAS domain-containing sensor histidine kinase [Candidatus Heimdallarchaeota archaeon]